jgi:N-acetylmuramoyl-L-alanine amidase
VALLAGTLGWGTPVLERLVVVRDGSSFSVPVEEERGYPAARADSLADALGYAHAGSVIRMDGESVRFTAGSPFFVVGEQIYQLPNPTYASGPQLMIPASWALEWLPSVRPRQWTYMDGRLVERPPVTMRPPERDSWLVVIDAGHGGRDPGTIGVGGTREKDVTLAIAKQLANRLGRESDVEVVLTRDSDTLVSFADRPRVPHLRGQDAVPDLFISIHANSMPRKPHSARGFETYFLAIARTEEALQVALRENESLQYEDGASDAALDPLGYMLTDLQSTANLRESRVLATSINRSSRGEAGPVPGSGRRHDAGRPRRSGLPLQPLRGKTVAVLLLSGEDSGCVGRRGGELLGGLWSAGLVFLQLWRIGLGLRTASVLIS